MIIWTLTGDDLDRLLDDLDGNVRSLRFAVDADTLLKWKINEDVWDVGVDAPRRS